MPHSSDSKPGRSLTDLSLITIGFALLLVFPAGFAILLSTGGQPGHITAFHAFLAPFLGPWSPVLPPNAHGIAAWPSREVIPAVALTVGLLVLLGGSYRAKKTVIRIGLRCLTGIGLLVWAAFGLSKVILELS